MANVLSVVLSVISTLILVLVLADLIVTFFDVLRYKKDESITEERDYYKEKYEQLKLDQIQELLDDRDFGNND